MERRVIKVNLVGLICVVTLIIAAIVGLIVFAISKINDSNSSGGSGSSQEAPPEVNPAEYEQKTTVNLNGEETQVAVEDYISSLSYNINNIKDLFTIEKTGEKTEVYKSKADKNVSIEVEKFDDGFFDISSDLISKEAKKMREDETYKLETINLNGRLCYIERNSNEENTYLNYYIENNKSYFNVKVRIGNNVVEEMQPIIEKMMLSFRVTYN